MNLDLNEDELRLLLKALTTERAHQQHLSDFDRADELLILQRKLTDALPPPTAPDGSPSKSTDNS